ncbi:STAS domain-containing protein [Nocardia sp. NPDC055321]
MSETDPERMLQVHVVHEGPVRVVSAVGEVDLVSAPLLERAIREVLGEDPPVLVVDLSRVGFFGSSGLTVLVMCARASARPIRVVASSQVRRPIEVTGMDAVVQLFDTLDEARAATATSESDTA